MIRLGAMLNRNIFDKYINLQNLLFLAEDPSENTTLDEDPSTRILHSSKILLGILKLDTINQGSNLDT